MKRVLVIGSCGSGKSTFARRLGEKTGLKVIHLDRLYWKPNWVGTTDEDEWKAAVEKALAGEAWIIDGNYSGTMEMRLDKCDTVFFLDMPRALCVYRILKRLAFYRKGRRPDMADGCDEKFDWEFVKWTWNYPLRSKPKVEALLKRFENEKKIIRLKSRREVENFLANYPAMQ
ncbi:MAG: DNA topology modulation protein [Acidobacteriota bacterium]|nr:DNA topology modulation protein [Acidobacteriota bacterium]